MKIFLQKFICWQTMATLMGLLILNVNTVFAGAQISLTVKNPDPYTGNQSWFVYERKAGDTIEDIATIKNFGDEPATVKITSVDATSNTSGSFILKFENEEQKSIGVWTEIETKELTIQPGERVDVPFKITIPPNITPGQYIGGIVTETGSGHDTSASADCEKEENCKTSVSVKTRIGARVYLTVPGSIKEDVQVTDFRYGTNLSGKYYFKFKIENRGNVSYEPKGNIQILDGLGNVYDEFQKPLGDSSPNTVIEPTVQWDKKPPLFNHMTARATVSFPKRFQTESERLHGSSLEDTKIIQFWIIPWFAATLLFVVVLSGSSCFAYAHFSRRNALKNSVKYEVQENEDLNSIAEKNHTSWKKLARVNRLKAPYIIKKGDTINIPKAQNKKHGK